jgi:hypothetical protein
MYAQEFILSIADKALECSSTYITAGHNGPYFDTETPVRVYGNWLIVFARCFEITGKKKYYDKVQVLAEKILQDKYRPFAKSYYHRDKVGKDHCNGLVGQAWTFEALARASQILNDQCYVDSARSVYHQHNFNHELGLWNRLEIDGARLSIDDTFNHQLWFAACALLLSVNSSDSIATDVRCFIDSLNANLTIMENGLIYHPIERALPVVEDAKVTLVLRVKKILRPFYVGLLSKPKQAAHIAQAKMINKSIGYHSFNMYAFAMLKQRLPGHPFWDSKEMNKMVLYIKSDEYSSNIVGNKYSFSYNPPGYEVPFSLSVLDEENIEQYARWVNMQLHKTYSENVGMFDRNNEDAVTLTSRIYELTRLENLNFHIDIGK